MKRWTKKDVDTVVECIKENPHNVNDALMKAARTIHRSLDSVKFKYYHNIKHNINMFSITPQSRVVNKLNKLLEDNYNVKNKMKKKDEIVIESFKEVCSVYTDVVMRVGNKQIKAAKATICTIQ